MADCLGPRNISMLLGPIHSTPGFDRGKYQYPDGPCSSRLLLIDLPVITSCRPSVGFFLEPWWNHRAILLVIFRLFLLSKLLFLFGEPVGIRTRDLLIKSHSFPDTLAYLPLRNPLFSARFS